LLTAQLMTAGDFNA